jgi:hypothetical protein
LQLPKVLSPGTEQLCAIIVGDFARSAVLFVHIARFDNLESAVLLAHLSKHITMSLKISSRTARAYVIVNSLESPFKAFVDEALSAGHHEVINQKAARPKA